MPFAWDEGKAEENERKHRVTLAEAETVFDDPLAKTFLEPAPRSPNGAACPSPKPHRASRHRLAASAGCARRPPLSAGELGETSGGGAGATGGVGASGGKGRSRAAAPPRSPSRAGYPAAVLAVPGGAGRWPTGSRQGGPALVWALPGPPWQGLRPAGSMGRVGRPQAWAPAGAGWQGVGGRGRGGLREK